MTKQGSEQGWWRVNDEYMRTYGHTTEQLKVWQELQKDTVDSILSARPALRSETASIVIDFGCGQGTTSAYLEEAGFAGRYIGVDRSRQALLEAKKRHGKQSFVQAETLADFKDGEADAVLAINSLNQMDMSALKSRLKEMHRALKDEGVVGIVLPSLSAEVGAKDVLKQEFFQRSGFEKLLFFSQTIRNPHAALTSLRANKLIQARAAQGNHNALTGEELESELREAGFREVELSTAYAETCHKAIAIK